MPTSRRSLTYIFIALAVIVVAALLYKTFPSSSAQSAGAGQLASAVATYKTSPTSSSAISSESSQAAEIQSDGQTVIWYSGGKQFSTVESSADVISKEFQDAGYYNYKVDSGSGGNFLLSVILPNLILFGLMALILLWIFRQTQSGNNQAMSFGRSRARLLAGDKPAITFVDVAGVDEAKQELNEIVEFLKSPEKFQRLGGRIPRGVLLVGPPGTGKTLLARAIAGEANVPFFTISGSDFVEMFVGVGASRVRDMFEQAKKNAPCIIFIDEIDAVGRARGVGMGGGNDEREQTLNQLLVEMDGFDKQTNVIVIAATNRPDVLDAALLRPGRFDRQVMLDKPDIRGRLAILEVHARGKPLENDVLLVELARQTAGFSGADLSNLLNEAALLAARRGKSFIQMVELEESILRVMAGPERKSRIITEAEKSIIAYHEVGHAIVMRSMPGADPVRKVQAIARGMALGITVQAPSEDRYLMRRSELEAKLAGAMGGRAAEEIIFGDITTGASQDIEYVTNIARRMVCEFGMSPLGNVAYKLDGDGSAAISADTATKIDKEISLLVEQAYARALSILRERQDKLIVIAEHLIQVETIDGSELDEMLFAA